LAGDGSAACGQAILEHIDGRLFRDKPYAKEDRRSNHHAKTQTHVSVDAEAGNGNCTSQKIANEMMLVSRNLADCSAGEPHACAQHSRASQRP
jgi:hypothetical protein